MFVNFISSSHLDLEFPFLRKILSDWFNFFRGYVNNSSFKFLPRFRVFVFFLFQVSFNKLYFL